jgi:hypothetical protein
LRHGFSVKRVPDDLRNWYFSRIAEKISSVQPLWEAVYYLGCGKLLAHPKPTVRRIYTQPNNGDYL